MLSLKEPKHVRWLSYDGTVTAPRKSYRAIVLELTYEATEMHCPVAKGLLKKVKTNKFVASLHLFSDVLPVLTKLSKKFQRADLNFA